MFKKLCIFIFADLEKRSADCEQQQKLFTYDHTHREQTRKESLNEANKKKNDVCVCAE